MNTNQMMVAAFLAALLSGSGCATNPTPAAPAANPAAPAAATPAPLGIKPMAERKVAELPAGTLYWRIENLESIERARAAANAHAHALAVEAAGKAWLFTLGPSGGSTAGATKVTEVGPIPQVTAPQYLLRINEATGTPGAKTPIHSHPGSEAFYVLAGEQSMRHQHGVLRIVAGKAEAGHGADMAMEVSSSGKVPLHSLVMFVVDATRPFSVPATMP